MQLGATFSHLWIKHLGLSVDQALEDFRKSGLKWMRVCCYWDEIESEKGTFDFHAVKKILAFCQKHKIQAIVTVGMKAPRYPEYFFPSWVSDTFHYMRVIKQSDKELTADVLRFVKQAVQELKRYSAIKIWQVENEPFDPSGKKYLSISEGLIEKEISTIRKLDKKRKVLITLWGNALSHRKHFSKAITHADIVGLDLYFKVPFVLPFVKKYGGMRDSQAQIKRICKMIQSQKKTVCIAELQSEPWEKGVLLDQSGHPKSFLPSDFEKNLHYANELNADIVLFWGFEYWLWRKKNGDSEYWQEARRVIQAHDKQRG